jgi:hypothetical protein
MRYIGKPIEVAQILEDYRYNSQDIYDPIIEIRSDGKGGWFPNGPGCGNEYVFFLARAFYDALHALEEVEMHEGHQMFSIEDLSGLITANLRRWGAIDLQDELYPLYMGEEDVNG